METAQNKTIRLGAANDLLGSMAVHIMSVMNRYMYGRENILIRGRYVMCHVELKGRADTVICTGTTVIRKIQTGKL